jgi:F0F1-type ATP synthase assembly protein I
MIRVTCGCGEHNDIRDEMAGKTVKCGACAEPLLVPGAKSQGLSTSRFVAQTAESDLSPEQIRRIAKHRGKEHNRTGKFWKVVAGGGMMGFLVAFLLFRLVGVVLWFIILCIVAGFGAFFNYLDRQAAQADIAAIQQELEEKEAE